MALMDYKADQGWCNRCSNCKWIPSYRIKHTETMYICPAITRYNFNAYSGCGKLEIGYSINDGHSEVCESTQNVAYRCTLCGACDYACKVFRKDIDVEENIEELRKECVKAGLIYPEHQAVIDSIRENGNQMCRPAAERIDWTEGLEIKKVSAAGTAGSGEPGGDAGSGEPEGVAGSGEAADLPDGTTGEIYFYAGDVNTFSKTLAERTKAVAQLLLGKGLDLITSGVNEPTAADKAFDLGFIEAGCEAAEKLAAEVKRSGAAMLVTLDAHAYTAFRWYYPRYGIDLGVEVLHITQLLERMYKDGMIHPNKPADIKVTYHDPCNLGRRSEPYKGTYEGDKRRRPMELTRTGDLGEYQAPRTLLTAIDGLELIEMDRRKGWAWCCGNGAGVAEVNPDLLASASKNRMTEAELTGADVLVTACPMCESALAAAGGMEVKDLTELVLEYYE